MTPYNRHKCLLSIINLVKCALGYRIIDVYYQKTVWNSKDETWIERK